MNKANKNNEAKYICLLCIQPFEYPPPVMALVGCERSGRPGPPLKNFKKRFPLRKLFYLFIVAPGRCHLKTNTFRNHFVLRHYKASTLKAINFFLRSHFGTLNNGPSTFLVQNPPFCKAITSHHPTKCLQWCHDRCLHYT